MLYHIAGAITFTTAARAKTAYDLLMERLDDFSQRLEDSEPSISGNTVSFSVRFKSKALRDNIRDWLEARKSWVRANTSGYLSYHECLHDEARPCPIGKTVTWGGYE